MSTDLRQGMGEVIRMTYHYGTFHRLELRVNLLNGINSYHLQQAALVLLQAKSE